MKKFFTLAVMALCAIPFCSAQYTTQKVTVAIGNVTGNDPAIVEGFRAGLLSQTPSCRVNVMDYEVLKQRGEEATADYIIDAQVGDVAYAERELILSLSTDKGWNASFKYTLTMRDAMEGKQVMSKTGNASNTAASKEEALAGALNPNAVTIFQLINGGQKMVLKVLEATETNKKGNKAEVISVEGGTGVGLSNFMWFDVQQESEVSGHKTFKKIGSATVKEVLGDDISLLSVTKGAKDIMTALQEGKTIVVSLRNPNLLEEAMDLPKMKSICE